MLQFLILEHNYGKRYKKQIGMSDLQEAIDAESVIQDQRKHLDIKKPA